MGFSESGNEDSVRWCGYIDTDYHDATKMIRLFNVDVSSESYLDACVRVRANLLSTHLLSVQKGFLHLLATLYSPLGAIALIIFRQKPVTFSSFGPNKPPKVKPWPRMVRLMLFGVKMTFIYRKNDKKCKIPRSSPMASVNSLIDSNGK